MDSPLIIGIKQYFKKMMKQYDSNLDGIIDRAELATVLNFREVESLPETPLNWESLIHDKKLKVYNPLINQWEIIHTFMYGYSNFDNNGGGAWMKYINTPITQTPSEYAQYKIVIDSVNFSIYNSQGDLKTQADIASDFWNNIKSDGSDIRIFDQAKEQLYFWIEEFDYSNKKAVIWVKLEAGSSELNIAYGNPSATKSDYENGEQVFEFFDDFEDGEIDTSKWDTSNAGEVFSEINGYLYKNGANKYYLRSVQTFHYTFIFETKYYVEQLPSDTYYENVGGFSKSSSDGIGLAHNNTPAQRLWYDSTVDTVGNEDVQGKLRKLTIIAKEISTRVIDYDYETNQIKVDEERNQPVEDEWLYLGSRVIYSGSDTVAKVRWYWVKVLKLADPADFGTPQIVEF